MWWRLGVRSCGLVLERRDALANVGGMVLSAPPLQMEQDRKIGEVQSVSQGLAELEQCFSDLKSAMAKKVS